MARLEFSAHEQGQPRLGPGRGRRGFRDEVRGMKKAVLGRWRIVKMSTWDSDYIDMVSPGIVAFKNNGEGQLRFGCVDVELDWRIEGGSERVEFTFSGFDEGSEVSGRGWAEVQKSRMAGKIFLHMGDVSEFVARKAAATA